MWGQLSTTCSNVLKQPTEELLVAVNLNHLLIMASEMVDPIDLPCPHTSWAVPPECLVHCINQCNLSRNQTCNLSRNRTCNLSMRVNHLAYAATEGIQRNWYQTLECSQWVLVADWAHNTWVLTVSNSNSSKTGRSTHFQQPIGRTDLSAHLQ